MHDFGAEDDAFAAAVFAFAHRRAAADAAPGGLRLGRPRTPAELDAAAGPSVTAGGLGAAEVLRRFTEVLEPACLSVDHPGYLAFVPAAPTEVAIFGDLVTSACSIYAGSWLEGAGAVWAENQALRWLADLAGLPAGAGGCFVAGATNGNLSALVVARHAATRRLAAGGGERPARWVVVAGEFAHSSVDTAAAVMDAELVRVPGERLTGAALAPVLAELGPRVAAVVATAGTTNLGRVDDLRSVTAAGRAAGVWCHVDGAYGAAALAAPSARHRFAGIEAADSLVVDPHKWLFAPFDSCALLYAEPAHARSALAQHASYLDILTESGDWNPSDYAVHLSRRARGLPFWFSLAAHGADAYAAAVEANLAVAAAAADLVRAAPHLELVAEPELSIVAFRRLGWGEPELKAWSLAALDAGIGFVVPSKHAGEPILRLCVVNPRTTVDHVAAL
ncbi:MAG: pyridoxal-dependent decarboxylase, partial [Acidimicrobiales bacterium]